MEKEFRFKRIEKEIIKHWIYRPRLLDMLKNHPDAQQTQELYSAVLGISDHDEFYTLKGVLPNPEHILVFHTDFYIFTITEDKILYPALT